MIELPRRRAGAAAEPVATEDPRPAAPLPPAAPALELIELPELGFGGEPAATPVADNEAAFAETIESWTFR